MDETYLIEANSDEFQNITGRPPSRIIMNGNIIMLLIVALCLVGAWLIRFPDVISAHVTISSFNPPVKIIAQSNGRITDLLIKDGEVVEEKTVLAIVENTAVTKDMYYLKAIVDALDTSLDLKRTIPEIPLTKNLQVGELQSEYASLYQAIENNIYTNRNPYYKKKIEGISNQKERLTQIDAAINRKNEMMNDQLKLEAWKDSVNKVLLKSRVISLAEYNEIRKGYLSQNINTTEANSQSLQNKLKQQEYQQNITEVDQQLSTTLKDNLLTIKEIVKKLKGLIAGWEKQYILRSPVKGKVILFNVRKINQYVFTGMPICMIVPDIQEYEIRAQLPIYKAGKIKAGQKVLIKLSEYPFEEYGMLNAKVESISTVTLDSSYVLNLVFQNGLTTTRNLRVELKAQMYGNAEIITVDKNFLERLFDKAYGAIH